jgi:hypothetical protein
MLTTQLVDAIANLGEELIREASLYELPKELYKK